MSDPYRWYVQVITYTFHLRYTYSHFIQWRNCAKFTNSSLISHLRSRMSNWRQPVLELSLRIRLKKLEYITKTCESCQRIFNTPHRFRVTLGAENTRFSSDMYMDLVYIDDQPALQLVDEATRFSVPAFIRPWTTESVWETILNLWANAYTSIPSKVVFDEGSQFRDAFVEICELRDVEWKKSGVQQHSASGKRWKMSYASAQHVQKVNSWISTNKETPTT